ncbi:MAG: TrkA C-terminal domain-containing protein [Nitriliruptorales bacterium]|nr:TrkA C-terminal domain-containing protein [Nitriliruptorales bacterium]
MVREVEETVLPGVGLQFSFVTSDGKRLCVVARRSGRHQVSLSHPDDPDANYEVLDLDESDARQLAELLGGSQVIRDLEAVQQLGHEVTIEWIVAGAAADGQTLGDLHVRGETGATIVAILRDNQPIVNPGPETPLQEGDQLAVLGTPAGVEQATALFSG